MRYVLVRNIGCAITPIFISICRTQTVEHCRINSNVNLCSPFADSAVAAVEGEPTCEEDEAEGVVELRLDPNIQRGGCLTTTWLADNWAGQAAGGAPMDCQGNELTTTHIRACTAEGETLLMRDMYTAVGLVRHFAV